MDLLSHLPVFPQACPIRLYRHLACPRWWVWANPPSLAQEAHGVTHVRRAILTVSVKDLDLFATVKLLEDTPAVLSLRKLCEDQGYF